MRRLLLAVSALVFGASLLFLAFPGSPRWSEAELALVRSLSLEALPPVPADPSNRVADDPRAAELGRAIFFDARFSGNGETACASCHLPGRQFQDDLPLAQGIDRTNRRTMPLTGMAYAPFLFWDGRKDSLWSQALGPLESAVEHGGDRTLYAHLTAEHYGTDYEAIFGPLPELSGLPRRAGPVADLNLATAWERMKEEDREAVNMIFANIGKAIASYERTIVPPETRFDASLASGEFPQPGILEEEEIAGLRLFVGKAECVNCHNGPLLTDNHFHNTGVPAMPDLPEDRGREIGAPLVRQDPFNCLGPYSDAAKGDCTELRFMTEPNHEMLRAFKTPSLRGAAGRPPYMHAGQIRTLDEVLSHYAAAPEAPAGHSELQPLDLSETELGELRAFLRALTAIPGGKKTAGPASPTGAPARVSGRSSSTCFERARCSAGS